MATRDVVHAQLAPLSRRVVAFLLDAFIVLGVSVGYLFIAASAANVQPAPTDASGLDLLAHQLHAWGKVPGPAALLGLVLAFVYTALFGFMWGGHTPGRRIAGVRVVDARGRTPHPARALLRALLAIPSFAIVFAGFWMALFDRHGQTLHDKLTQTFVVRDE